MTTKKDFFKKLEDYDLIEREECTPEEIKKFTDGEIPDDVYVTDTNPSSYFRLKTSDLSDDQIKMLILLKQLEFLRTIKNCLVFIVALIIISLFLSYLSLGAH